ncbi:MAG: DUF1003 domain-containing protein [Gemmatimonadaceae bacterium]|nr:DUF1003 domain-containing protein [Acetobacteraceae bacterium]
MAQAATRTVRENIQAIVAIEDQQARGSTLGQRIGDAIAGFAGTISFVALHLAAFVVWAVVNRELVPGIPAFDPYPFSLLTMIVSMEGVLLTAFVLIKQNRMSALEDRRSRLDLQINLLTEKEVTKLIQMVEQIADRMGVDAGDAETRELGTVTAIGELSRELDQVQAGDGSSTSR